MNLLTDTESAPAEVDRSMLPPAEWYTSDSFLDTELETIFRKTWQYFCSTQELAKSGDYVAREIAGVPIVVVRDDEAIRAFVNVCAHRRHEVVFGCGNRSTLQCPYHAWTYGLDGKLRAAPRSDHEQSFNKEDFGLKPVRVDTWGPVVFVNLDSEGDQSLSEWMGRVPQRVSELGCDVDRLVFEKSLPFELKANWKIVAENYLECYHCAAAHRSLSGVFDTSPDAYTFQTSDGAFCANMVPRKKINEAVAGEYNARVGAEFASIDYLFPNFAPMLWPGPGSPVVIYEFSPVDPETTIGTIHHLFDKDASEADKTAFIDYTAHTWDEDVDLVESVQRGMASSMAPAGRLLTSEDQLANLHQLVREATSR